MILVLIVGVVIFTELSLFLVKTITNRILYKNATQHEKDEIQREDRWNYTLIRSVVPYTTLLLLIFLPLELFVTNLFY